MFVLLAQGPAPCAAPNVPPAIVRGYQPDVPAAAAQRRISGTVDVVIRLDESSRLVGIAIAASPSALLNAAALAAARGSVFRTEVRNCEPVAADYLFSVEFTSQ